MSLFTISDLHLPLGVNKPMNIFGGGWDNYVERIMKNWQSIITPEDTVVLPGDFSWAMYLDEAVADFEFLHSLNGTKILLKGNHDYWWETKGKMNKFLSEKGFSDIKILHNDFYISESTAICGNRGWTYPPVSEEDKKLYERELQRLELSIQKAYSQIPDNIIVFTHYPPISPLFPNTPFVDILKKYNIKKCFYGHLHGASLSHATEGIIDGIEYRLISSDYRKFVPYKITNF